MVGLLYSLDRRQTDLNEVPPSVDEVVRQLVESCVVLYHAVHRRIHATAEHVIKVYYRPIIQLIQCSHRPTQTTASRI